MKISYSEDLLLLITHSVSIHLLSSVPPIVAPPANSSGPADVLLAARFSKQESEAVKVFVSKLPGFDLKPIAPVSAPQ